MSKPEVLYSFEQSSKASLEYFNGDFLAADVFADKYRHECELTPDDMHDRLAKNFAIIEEVYSEPNITSEAFNDLTPMGKLFYQGLSTEVIRHYVDRFRYIVPQGSVMQGLGSKQYISLSNCLRLPPPKDSYSSILWTDSMLVNAAKRRCGYGLGLSGLRPRGATVSNAAKSSTGAASFMARYSNSTREVAQEGRRGACLLDIDVTHPDVLEFAKSKIDKTQITGANISVKIYDAFMDAYENNKDFYLTWPTLNDQCGQTFVQLLDTGLQYNKLYYFNIDDENPIYIKKINPKEYWYEFIKLARDNAEPGLFFWDRMLNYDPTTPYEHLRIDGTNACGEQPMAVFDTCRLIATNLLSLVSDKYTSNACINEELAYKVFYIQQRLGDDLVDLEIQYAQRIIDKIKADNGDAPEYVSEIMLWEGVVNKAQRGRRTGSGLTGLGDMIAALNLRYGSQESKVAVEKIMKIKMRAELDCSIDLAITRGPFPDYDYGLEYPDGNVFNDFYEMLLVEFPDQVVRMKKYGRRNCNWSTIAPTGTVSVMTQTTSGCEPLFKAFYTRRKKINPNMPDVRVDFVDQNGDSWQEYFVLHEQFKKWIIAQYDGHIDIDSIDKALLTSLFRESPWCKSEADDIDWIDRVEIQSILQKYTTSAISSTINLPSNVTVEDVEKIYYAGYKLGCKGITVYREGSRSGVLVSDSAIQPNKFGDNNAPKRPKTLPANVYFFMNHGEKWVGIIGLMDDRPYELFTGRADALSLVGNVETGTITKNKNNGISSYDLTYVDGRGNEHTMTGLSTCFNQEYYNYGKLISSVLRHGMPIPYVVDLVSNIKLDQDSLNTWKAGVARILKRYIKDGTQATDSKCSNCGDKNGLIYEEGCLKCKNCGSAKCG